MELANPTFPRDTLVTPMIMMINGGVPITTLIDIGAADGTFGLTVLDAVNAGMHLLNIDAQETYTGSLQRIQSMLGEPYRITAVGDHDGEIRVRKPQHEYWLSTAAHMGAGKDGADTIALPCRRLDSICAEVGVKGPVFIKLDVEGAELDVLKGSDATLKETCGLLIECPVRQAGGPQFFDIYRHPAERDFSLFDMVRMSHRGSDATLYQFYAVFIANRFDFRGKSPLRSVSQQAEVTAAVVERRQNLMAENTSLMASIKLKRSLAL